MILSKEYGYAREKITGQKHDSAGNILGFCHSNPFLDNHVYELKFQYGPTKQYGLVTYGTVHLSHRPSMR